MDELIRVEEVTRTYALNGQSVPALKGITMTVPRASLVALKGRSGSGKTTLLNIIGGLDQADSGRVWIDGIALDSLTEAQRTKLRREKLGFIFQSFALLPTYSAFENVEFVLRLAGMGVKEAQQRTKECLKAVGLLNRLHNRPDELSGGQQQRVAVARAMANHPLLILADEPTGELDTETTRRLLTLLRQLVDQHGITLLVTSHDPLIDEVADRIYEISDGRIKESGKVKVNNEKLKTKN